MVRDGSEVGRQNGIVKSLEESPLSPARGSPRAAASAGLILPATLPSPKQRSEADYGHYRYYAAFSQRFADAAVRIAAENKRCRVLDPWNGSGTTTRAAAGAGLSAVGVDLNPVMAILAKARLATDSDRLDAQVIADDIVKLRSESPTPGDPLQVWLRPKSAATIRMLASAIGARIGTQPRCFAESATRAEALAMVALFRTVRVLVQPFEGTNPTWIKTARRPANRVGPAEDRILRLFTKSFADARAETTQLATAPDIDIRVGDSARLPELAARPTFVLTSPPYCTRLDYGIATKPELATLGLDERDQRDLRRRMLGTTTVPKTIDPTVIRHLPAVARERLDIIMNHSSKASATYYWKSIAQYFASLFESLSSITSVVDEASLMLLVVQDSFYKEVPLLLPEAIVEGLEPHWALARSYPFPSGASQSQFNPFGRAYRTGSPAGVTEHALLFERRPGCDS
jgi:hypothetical protein